MRLSRQFRSRQAKSGNFVSASAHQPWREEPDRTTRNRTPHPHLSRRSRKWVVQPVKRLARHLPGRRHLLSRAPICRTEDRLRTPPTTAVLRTTTPTRTTTSINHGPAGRTNFKATYHRRSWLQEVITTTRNTTGAIRRRIKGTCLTTTKRKKLEQVYKATGKKPPELNTPPLPEEFLYIWHYWCDLHGSELLSFSEMQSWAILNQIELKPFEAHALRQLDVIYFSGVNHGS